jgi:Arc/MetJ-type ribon-helix-helix transcriptional regulator
VKISVSLPDDDIAFIDSYCAEKGRPSRSAVLHEAINLLREQNLSTYYEAAFKEFAESGDAALWDVTANDGTA